eukprot:GABW01001967.1.p1 GENE.GABW01001967.1~~GABW01001967.1.p1  ORF type:complete len:68 (-),score=12.46 GABW01001967.1:3-206(-)
MVELALTMPVRLSSLIKHLHLLMPPLTFALKAKESEYLVTQGLRTIEVFGDNLISSFLEPVMSPHST